MIGNDSRMKILDLPLKAIWYLMIESGEKPEEYREITESVKYEPKCLNQRQRS